MNLKVPSQSEIDDILTNVMQDNTKLNLHPVGFIFIKLFEDHDAFSDMLNGDWTNTERFISMCASSTLSTIDGGWEIVHDYIMLCMLYAYVVGRQGKDLVDVEAITMMDDVDKKARIALAVIREAKMDNALTSASGMIQ
jgi:hypothetical protein